MLFSEVSLHRGREGNPAAEASAQGGFTVQELPVVPGHHHPGDVPAVEERHVPGQNAQPRQQEMHAGRTRDRIHRVPRLQTQAIAVLLFRQRQVFIP